MTNTVIVKRSGIPGPGSEVLQPLVDLAEAAAAIAEVASSEAAGYVAGVTGVYSSLSEFTGGAVGAYGVAELEYFFTDTAGTTPAAVGDLVACWKPVYSTSTNFDQIQADSAKRPTLREMCGLLYLDYANGKCLYSRSTVSLKCPQTILHAGNHAGTTAQPFFGFFKNTTAQHSLGSDSFDRVRGYSSGGSDLARPLKIATTADYSSPIGALAVHYSELKAAAINAKMELGLDKSGNSPIVTAWADGDTIAGMTLGINCATQSGGIGVPNSNASCKTVGWMVIDRALANPAGVVEFFKQYTTIEMRDADLSIFELGDSTTDNQTVTPEIGKYFALNGLVPDNTDKDVIYRIWNRLSNCYTGQQLLTAGDKAERIFMTAAASAGSQPGYFTAARFEAMSDIPHVDERIVGHGHNLAVTESISQNHAQAGLLRLGEFIEMEDQLRTKWPNAPVLMIKQHPYRLDNRLNPIYASQDLLQSDIYGDLTFARIDLAFEATGRNPALYQSDGVHHTAAGVTLAGDTLIDAYNAWVRPAQVTGPVLTRRRVPLTETVLPNAALENYTGSVPTGATLVGGASSKSFERTLRGASCKLVGAASGDSYLEWSFNAVPYRGQTVVLTIMQLIVSGADLETGRIQAGSDGTGNVGNSWIYNPNNSFDTWEPRILHLPIPANANTAFFRIWGGSGATGTCYIDEVTTVVGTTPRRILT